MKNISVKTFMFILLLALGACKKDDENTQLANAFSVKVTQNMALPYVVTSKDDIVFDLTITSNSANKIKDAVLSLDGNDLHTATVSDANQVTLQYTYEVTGTDIGKSLIFRLTVSDEQGNSVDKDLTVYIQSAPADINIAIPGEAPTEIKDNESANFDIAVVSENDIKYIKTFLDQTEITSLTKETFASPKEDTYHFTYQPTVADADKTLSFTIEVMDVLGNIVKQTYSLNIIRSQEADFNFYTDVNLGAQRSTAFGPFFNASNGEVYITTGAAAKSAGIDLINFYSGSTYAYNITSPTLATVANNVYTVATYGEDGMANWSVKNQTLIKKITLTREEFDLLASSAAIQALYTGSGVAESETSGGLANNNVIVFKTASGKYGVLYVKSRSANANTGYLTVDIKVQK
ncbi:hypothetical protein FW774_08050 [Pedobacter sp. BS3]|uniref:hypothetical protein n=1 Tax=Pedobacter sp. BS3 TaxID=2567937 RepID=UPI0011EC37C9|nr:hypothetical protein [Pedobacter sp. BS3]TZF84915.1 hypothetical protein FW774_08050 [Pedobacter sp. BS3]